MPFTFAHPAAVVPLQPCLGRFGVLSALVIGSMAPDFPFFFPWAGVSRSQSHSLFGLLWFCLPAGWLVYGLFHTLLKGPVLGLLPPGVLDRLGGHVAHDRALPAASWSAVLVSLLCGALTHVAWDSFTHADGAAVMVVPALRAHLFAVNGYRVSVYTALQHMSTFVGIALLLLWSWRALEQVPPASVSLPVTLPPAWRWCVIGIIVGITMSAGLWVALRAEIVATGVPAVQVFAGKAIFAGLPAFGLAVVAYGLGWHAWRLRKSRSKLSGH